MDNPTSPPLSVFLPDTANIAAASTTADPTNSSLKPNHLKNKEKQSCFSYFILDSFN